MDPYIPFVAGSDTSKEAAEAFGKKKAEILREQVFQIIAASEVGATDEEIQTISAMKGNTQRPRRIELVQAGRVKDSGGRRPTKSGRNAVVWITV